MFNCRSHSALPAISAVLVSAIATGAAWADNERPDVDIDSLRASIWYDDGRWHIHVKYEVEAETEDGVPDDLRLVLFFTERGRVVADPRASRSSSSCRWIGRARSRTTKSNSRTGLRWSCRTGRFAIHSG